MKATEDAERQVKRAVEDAEKQARKDKKDKEAADKKAALEAKEKVRFSLLNFF